MDPSLIKSPFVRRQFLMLDDSTFQWAPTAVSMEGAKTSTEHNNAGGSEIVLVQLAKFRAALGHTSCSSKARPLMALHMRTSPDSLDMLQDGTAIVYYISFVQAPHTNAGKFMSFIPPC
jgi:hypothetical protein